MKMIKQDLSFPNAEIWIGRQNICSYSPCSAVSNIFITDVFYNHFNQEFLRQIWFHFQELRIFKANIIRENNSLGAKNT